MPRSVETTEGGVPSSGDRQAYRHFGDGYAGDLVAARLQAYDSSTLAYVDVVVDASGQLKTVSAGGGGGAVTVADGADVAQGTTTDASSANTVVGLLKAIKAAITGTLAVSGTFWQATQPVSLATNTPDVTDRAARLLGVVDKGKVWDGTNIAAVKAGVTAVSGDNPLVVTVHPSSAPTVTQPVSAASLPLPTGAATSANQSTIKAASTLAAATDTSAVVQQSPMRADASTLCVTNTGAAAAAVTVTLPAAAAGLFHYITSIQIVKFASALLTAAATPVLVTTTNLPGSPVFSFSAAASAQGTDEVQTLVPTTPLKSSVAATATTVVGPATTATIWRITATYYTAP